VIVHRLETVPPPALAHALQEFEREFSYPLGPGRSFRIAHGDDYPRFFRAMGQAACFVAEAHGRVLGTLAVAIRRLGWPDGTERAAAYLADLKVTAGSRGGGRTLLALGRAAAAWAKGAADAGFSVVMDGTAATPERYTGRLGFPAFGVLAKIAVLRIASPGARAEIGSYRHDAVAAARCYRDLSGGRYWSPGGDPASRSLMAPIWLLDPSGAACGRLEDTRHGKRLIADDGSELVSAHLACFAFRDVPAGAGLLRAAVSMAADLGCPALFVAVGACEAGAVADALTGYEVTVAPATVYGVGPDTGVSWNINTSEI
jgi:hypothetical protein